MKRDDQFTVYLDELGLVTYQQFESLVKRTKPYDPEGEMADLEADRYERNLEQDRP